MPSKHLKVRKSSKSATKGTKRRSRSRTSRHQSSAENISGNETPLYVADMNSKIYRQPKPLKIKKVREIANRIHEIAAKADPSVRESVLNEATVRFNK